VLIFSLVRNEERENRFIWVDSIAPRQHLFFYKLAKRTDLKISSLEDAKKLKIG
jgi:hypothetical protein